MTHDAPFYKPEPGVKPSQVQAPPQPAPKRLIVCCDGTWNSSDKAGEGDSTYETNVTRMCRVIPAEATTTGGRPITQIVYYQSGVGTKTVGLISAAIAGAFGLGIEGNIMAAYHFLVNNYFPGDEIFFFGFSRGSFTVRSVAGLVSNIGIIPRNAAHSKLPGLWTRYKAVNRGPGSQDMKNLRDDIHSHKYNPVTIKVVGCWDTVGSLGIPLDLLSEQLDIKKYGFHDTCLSPQIENAFHALALDERRRPFSPTLWYIPPNSGLSTNLKQCWFPGVHADVGRGYDDHVRCDFADISFAWMLDQCRDLLGFVSWEVIDNIFDRDDFNARKTGRKARVDAALKKYGGAPLHDSLEHLYRLTATPRTPGEYHLRQPDKRDTKETIHPSVRAKRMNDPTWVCGALRGFTYKKIGDKWTWVKQANGQEVKIDEEEYPKPHQISRFHWCNDINKLLG